MNTTIEQLSNLSISTHEEVQKPTSYKLFVGGLSQLTTDDSLRQYFSVYGSIVESVVLRDQLTGRSRGFGFVKYLDQTAIDRVTSAGPHFVDGKRVDPKPAIPKQNVPTYDMRYVKRGSELQSNPKKIFVGGLSQSITSKDLRDFFEPRFGVVLDTQVMIDKDTDRSRGFGFVTFADADSVEEVFRLLESEAEGAPAFLTIDGQPIDVKRAIPRSHIHRNPALHPMGMAPMPLPLTSMPLSTMSLSAAHAMPPQQPPGSAPGVPSLNIITSSFLNPPSNVAAFMPMTPLSAFYSPLDWQRNFNMASPMMIPSPTSTAFHFPVSADAVLTTMVHSTSPPSDVGPRVVLPQEQGQQEQQQQQ